MWLLHFVFSYVTHAPILTIIYILKTKNSCKVFEIKNSHRYDYCSKTSLLLLNAEGFWVYFSVLLAGLVVKSKKLLFHKFLEVTHVCTCYFAKYMFLGHQQGSSYVSYPLTEDQPLLRTFVFDTPPRSLRPAWLVSTTLWALSCCSLLGKWHQASPSHNSSCNL